MAKVIFLENIKNVAKIGDVKEVASGYARNFLFPRNLAEKATPKALEKVATLKKKQGEVFEKEAAQNKIIAQKLSEAVFQIHRLANEEGTLYDGLDPAELSAYLKKEGYAIEPEMIILERPIKTLGQSTFEVELDKDSKIVVKIDVQPEE
ncbi:MAG: 50S ribosomal protein L9 [Candidatus Yanofskybacteria bacterium CG10_big_fil_rev_8_21_14_0_10_46_23]|uniref:Large ribosomal subunit protein bL9 n=1 Tax=Candidatus Yanofskybacteria bacterium CG10_big_fil_rev_8_21_14_0_10_46_23 TaxID=1975098 RepID=A0A2H0R6Q1_9BACT|nr:MAG: 50S ribosomal protein L9 [Candidatus Yanofskybacteria bacterium CG10_big_fil_rev_8_21_14_0_10_46_23]